MHIHCNTELLLKFQFYHSYILASCIKGPNETTVVDFWRLVWQEHPQSIVMMVNVVEDGKTKCEKYWPSRKDGSQTFGPFQVSILNEVTLPDYIVRTLEVCVSLISKTASL